mmetsp:Transcript_4789/g.7399  ORF Transcript_4789/g.7399 Transcript_4789/m.7399 type:complete len:140 (-) Transcript_4789:1249-1668(-)
MESVERAMFYVFSAIALLTGPLDLVTSFPTKKSFALSLNDAEDPVLDNNSHFWCVLSIVMWGFFLNGLVRMYSIATGGSMTIDCFGQISQTAAIFVECVVYPSMALFLNNSLRLWRRKKHDRETINQDSFEKTRRILLH